MVQEPRLPSCRGVIDGSSVSSAVALRWFAPADPSDGRAHAEWCRTVGPAVVEPAPARHPDSVPALEAGSDDLWIASWNTHVGGADLIAFVRDLRGGRWSGGVPVRHAVLLVQEVFRDGPEVPPLAAGQARAFPDAVVPRAPASGRLDIVDAARRLGLAVFYAPSMRNGAARPEDRGNAILSTLPLADLQVIELPFERQRRVAVAASVAVPGTSRRIVVASAHLDNRGSLRRLVVLSSAARRRQAQGLIAALPGEGPAVVGGDLNTWLSGREGALIELRRAFPDTPPARGATFGSLRLDYLFFRLEPGWRASWHAVDERYQSDHRPVVARLCAHGCTESSRISLTPHTCVPQC
jgi:endonuclease/exonuclease/phosphatase family metal-dependent hydrolase